jgi:hypothetical protein
MITLFSIIALGFFLGMRHATDPDHVVAVTTIVTHQRSVRHAALIGTLWGLGHTITIFVIGSGIILFGLVIPPKVGLTMELSVGLSPESFWSDAVGFGDANSFGRGPASPLRSESRKTGAPRGGCSC